MEGRVFTFVGLFSDSHAMIFLGHTILVAFIIFYLSNRAMSYLRMVPRGSQNIFELYLEGVLAMGRDVMGEKLARKYLPLVATLGLYIFFANLIGIIPGFESPSSNINFTLPLALLVFFYYHYEGIKEHGVKKYFGHFMGPIPILAPLMFPVEIISHISRIISLSFRLFGNIKGDDLFLAVLLMLAPWIMPMTGFLLLSFGAVLQAFIFMILTFVYLQGAVLMSDVH